MRRLASLARWSAMSAPVAVDHGPGPPAGEPHQVALRAAAGEPVVGEGVPSVRTRRVQRIRVAILPGRFECGTFALMMTRRVAISGPVCDARHIVRIQ
jgi:hypothetical protein